MCRWSVGRILLTQIGRTAPVHDVLVQDVAGLRQRAAPAWDGLRMDLGQEGSESAAT